MNYRPLGEKGGKPLVHINNEYVGEKGICKRKERALAYNRMCQVVNMEGVLEMENRPFETIKVKTDLGKNCQCLPNLTT